MKHINMGILAHVDAGKTTLSESLLYMGGAIRSRGRVDHGDTFFDTDRIERERGITIFSKQTEISFGELSITLLDTPGHVDFSAETERTLCVLDYAILVISGLNGVQSHTRKLWQLLAANEVPVILFVNKMDIARESREELFRDIREALSLDAVDFSGAVSGKSTDDFFEEIAMAEESLLEEYMESGAVAEESIRRGIRERKIFPVLFGSALKSDGVSELVSLLERFCGEPVYPEEFSARVFKIARDKNNTRLTYLKVTGGTLSVKDTVLPFGAYPDQAKKVNEIRIITGEKHEAVSSVPAGHIAAVTGLDESYAGQGLGAMPDAELPLMIPVLSYRVLLSEEQNPHEIYDDFLILADEDPMLSPVWEEKTKSVGISLMGKIQLEVLREKMRERFGEEVDFGTGKILYKETIATPSVGHGHYEPLRHFADVILKLEPLPAGSGIVAATECSFDVLDKNYQNQILRNLTRREIAGVLTGSALTDVKFTILEGRSHKKHTEGGDFRKATGIAVRDGLLRTDNLLLEPYYHVTLDIPTTSAGRAMTDVENMHGKLQTPQITGDRCVIEGSVPVATAMDYAAAVQSYTGGLGEVRMELEGYFPCHNASDVIAETGYDFRSDLSNPYESVYVHRENPIPAIEGNIFSEEAAGALSLSGGLDGAVLSNSQGGSALLERDERGDSGKTAAKKNNPISRSLALNDELERIFRQTYGEVRRSIPQSRETIIGSEERVREAREQYLSAHPELARKKQKKGPVKHYLLVDGYNVIFAWPELKALAADNLDSARGRLLDILSNYQGYTGVEIIVVFDAYKVKGNPGSVEKLMNLYVVYTKEAQTADAYIERATHEIIAKENARISVVTSDGLVQMIVAGDGAVRISAPEFALRVEEVSRRGGESMTDTLGF